MQYSDAIALPDARTGNMATLRPALKRAAAADGDMKERLLGVANTTLAKRFREQAGGPGDSGVATTMSAMRSVLPSAISGAMSVENTGFSGLDAQTDEQIVLTVMAQPFRYHHWEQSYCEFMPLFVHRNEQGHRDYPNIVTVGSVPVINTLLEAHEAASGRGNVLVGGAAAQATQAFSQAYARLVGGDTAVEVGERWNWLGNFTQHAAGGNIYSSNASERRAGLQRTIGYTRWLRSNVFNIFSTQPRAGQQLYLTLRECDISPYENVLDPEGNTLARRSAPRASALQMVGMTDSDCGALYPNTGCLTAHDFAKEPASFSCVPRDGLDSDYVRRQHRAAQQSCIIDFGDDDNLDKISVKYLAQAEGVQAALDSVPQVVYDAYMEGVVYPIGIVREAKDARPSHSALQRALRSHDAMKQVGVLEIYGK